MPGLQNSGHSRTDQVRYVRRKASADPAKERRQECNESSRKATEQLRVAARPVNSRPIFAMQDPALRRVFYRRGAKGDGRKFHAESARTASPPAVNALARLSRDRARRKPGLSFAQGDRRD